MSIPTHTYHITLPYLIRNTIQAQGLLLFHQVFQRHVFPSIRRHQEPEQPELWQPFCDGYEVSSHGRVRSRRQVLVNLLDSREEPIQVIRGKWYRVKRLVAEHFLPNPDGKRRLRHINGDTHDCHATNLEWW